ncbi:MAG: DUF1592 domain-containing protein [Polyangiaceae bacterium]|nr:DUF1592 domain-containing protein [Polyangiaceae bacterium]
MRRSSITPLIMFTLAGCVGEIGSGPNGGVGDDGGDVEPEAVFEPAPAALPRLTEAQYRSALAILFGSSLPELHVEPDTSPYLFESIGAGSTSLSELGTQQYEENADAITHHVFGDPLRRATFVGCEVTAPGDACTRSLLRDFGRRAFRRSLSQSELDGWVEAATLGSTPDGWEGLRLAVAGMLQSPMFLYRVELGEPDPESPGSMRLTDIEMASRLSFLIWNTIPDEALLDAAESGALSTPEGVRTEAERLLESPRAKVGLHKFFDQYLDLAKLDGVTRNPESYPLYTPEIIGAMRHEVELIVDDIVFARRSDARTLFSTRDTFVNSDLAALYGVVAEDADATTFVPVTLDESGPRAGILTLGAFLTMNAHETQTSPTTRGKYIRERVLCELVPPPPPEVATELPGPGDAPKTLRERLEEHRKNPTCAACHASIDPPGLLFEHFDSIGVYRDKETPLGGGAPLPIDSSGDLDGEPLADAKALAHHLETDVRVPQCLVRQLYRHASSRLETEGEKPLLEELAASFEASSFDFQSLLVELVASEDFRRASAPTTEDGQ